MYVCVFVCVCLYVFVYVCGVSVWYGWVFCQPFEQHFVFGKAWGRATARGTEGTTSNAALCVQRLLYTKVTRREGSEEWCSGSFHSVKVNVVASSDTGNIFSQRHYQ